LIILRILFLLLVLSIVSCGKTYNEKSNNVTIKDDFGNDVVLEKTPSRIISLAPSITETLYAIGADSLLSGVTDYCDYPEAAKNKPKVGGMIDPNLETIISMNPDLILVSAEGNSRNTYQSLKNLGYKIFASNPRNFEDVLKMVKNIGTLTNHNLKADSVINKMISQRSNILSKVNNLKTDTCFVLISITPLMTASKNTFINEIINYSGFYNLYSDESIPYPEINSEDILKKKPEYIIFPSNIKDSINLEKSVLIIQKFLKLNSFNSNKRILIVDENLIFRPGPRMMDASEQLLYRRLN
jgi:iron complex transport system substrate-binding protein